MLSLEKVWKQCKAYNKPFAEEFLGFPVGCCLGFFLGKGVPNFKHFISLVGDLNQLRIWLQSDNTVKEIRNTYTARMLCSFLQKGTFRVASEAHLAVGHTHEDIDSVFSLATSALRSSPDPLQTPRDMQRILESKLKPVFEKRGQTFSVDIVGVVSCLHNLFCLLSTTSTIWWDVCTQHYFLFDPVSCVGTPVDKHHSIRCDVQELLQSSGASRWWRSNPSATPFHFYAEIRQAS